MKKIITVAGLFFISYFSAHADKTIYVNTTAQGSGDGTSVLNACKLGDAIRTKYDAAVGAVTTIVLPPNATFTLTDDDGTANTSRFDFPATSNKFIIQGNNSTLDGTNAGKRIFRISNPAANVEINNLKFVNGKLAGSVGGAIYFAGSSLVLAECIFEGNSSDNGGAIASRGNYLKISNSVFKNNKLLNGYYGCALSHTGTASGGTLIVENTTFTNNAGGVGKATYGSAISTAWDNGVRGYLSTISINNCTFYKNLSGLTSTYGYAAVNLDELSGGTTTATFVNNTFYGNSNCGIYIKGIKQTVKLVNNVIIGDAWATISGTGYNDHGIIAEKNVLTDLRPAMVAYNNYIVAKGAISSTITELSSGTNGNTFVTTTAQSVIDAVNLSSTLTSTTIPYLTITNASSPLLNAGTNSVSGVTIPSTDITGFQRTAGYTIGAYQATLNVASGTTQTVNQDASLLTTVVEPTGKLTIASGKTLTTGTITIQSDGNGTGTLLNEGSLNNSNATVQQYLPDARNWYISSPVTGAVAPAGYTYYQHDEVTSSWTARPFVADSIFLRGHGYIALPSTTASTLQFAGTLNNGNVNIALSKSGTGYNLIGNPYPSNLTWTAAFVDDVNNAALIEPTIWIRTNAGTVNNSENASWSFLTYNGHSGEAVPATSLLSGGVIPPMQAFWIKAKAAGTLTLDNKLTLSHHSSNLLKVPAVKNINRQRIRLEVSNGAETDETLIYFDTAALDAYDIYDSQKMVINSATFPEIYSLAGNEKLVINGMTMMKNNLEIPLGFVAEEKRQYSLKVNELKNIHKDARIFLIDKLQNTITELCEGTSYEFSSGVTAANINRFSLLIRISEVSTNIVKNPTLNYYAFINADNQLTILAPDKSDYSIYNSVGQKILDGIISNNNFTLNNKLKTGMYVVRVGNKYSTRVIIK